MNDETNQPEVRILTAAEAPSEPIPGPVQPVRIESVEQLRTPPAPKKPKKRKETKAERLQNAAQAVLDAVQEAQQDAQEASAAYETAMEALSAAREKVEEALENLRAVREEEYQGWYENMNEGLQQTATGQKLEALLDIDLEPSMPDLPEVEEIDWSEIENAAQEILDAEYPLGFGKD